MLATFKISIEYFAVRFVNFTKNNVQVRDAWDRCGPPPVPPPEQARRREEAAAHAKRFGSMVKNPINPSTGKPIMMALPAPPLVTQEASPQPSQQQQRRQEQKQSDVEPSAGGWGDMPAAPEPKPEPVRSVPHNAATMDRRDSRINGTTRSSPPNRLDEPPKRTWRTVEDIDARLRANEQARVAAAAAAEKDRTKFAEKANENARWGQGTAHQDEKSEGRWCHLGSFRTVVDTRNGYAIRFLNPRVWPR